jgi:hypothetical protein
MDYRIYCTLTQLVTTLHRSPYDTSYFVTPFTSRCLVTGVNNGCSSASVLKSRKERLSFVNSTNWVPAWWSLHTNHLVFSSQADFQLTTRFSHSPNQLLHFNSLTWTAKNFHSGTRLLLLITFRPGPHRKHRYHCYNATIPRPFHSYLLQREQVYRAAA